MTERKLRIAPTLSILIAILVHLVLFFFLSFPAGNGESQEDPSLFKLVDIEEPALVPPQPAPRPIRRRESPPPPPSPTPTPAVEAEVEAVQAEPPAPEQTTEQVMETSTPIPEERPTRTLQPPPIPSSSALQDTPASAPAAKESPESPPAAAPSPSEPEGIEYLSAHEISVPPGIPVKRVLQNLVYPPQANRQRIEGVVYLELYIDRRGMIRKIEVLKDPGYGFAEAAVRAFEGIRCRPAEANGVPVAVRYRYPIRFKLR
ncbi:MAG: hypothetical protein Kow009_16530 [Spirochaetales bacterium]